MTRSSSWCQHALRAGTACGAACSPPWPWWSWSASLSSSVIAWLVGLSRSVFSVPANGVDGLDEFLDRVASLRLPWPRYAEVFGLAVLNWTADCGALACAIKATGQLVPWHSLLLVYGSGPRSAAPGLRRGDSPWSSWP